MTDAAAEGTDPEALVRQGLALHQSGDLRDACERYEAALALAPDHFDALHLLGVVQLQLQAPERAVALIGRALGIDPNAAAAHCNLALALSQSGDLKAALASADRAIALSADYVEAHVNRAAILLRLERPAPALASYDAALILRPGSAALHVGRARALSDLARYVEALAAANRAVALEPDLAEAHHRCGLALFDLDRLDAALAAFERSVDRAPGYAEAHANRAMTLYDLGRREEALIAADRALALRSDFPEVELTRAMSLLSVGKLREGFEAYRSRWRLPRFADRAPPVSCPLWDGQDVTGKSVLVWREQGFGDCIQFARYAPLLASIAGSVTLLADPPLTRLFRSLPKVEVLDRLEDDAGPFDYQIPLLCLPRVFGTTLETIPAGAPYLSANSEDAATWSARLEDTGDLRIGLVWSGADRSADPTGAAMDRRRSVSLARLAPLARVQGATFVSLQKGEAAAQAARPPAGMRLIDLTADLHDFADTAALISALDLVVTVDTAVAHLAGALGKPVWVLSRFDGCWRWLGDREDSPWHPTARIFRQRTSGDWDGVIERVAVALVQLGEHGITKP